MFVRFGPYNFMEDNKLMKKGKLVDYRNNDMNV